MSLWAITCLFNPAGYRVRPENYRLFRDRLRLPLLTVELAFDGDFALSDGDGDIMVRRMGGARLWQKERLLNIAIDHLPSDCDAVVAVDADLFILDEDWGDKVRRALDQYPVIQPYSVVHQLDPQMHRASYKYSTVARWSHGGVGPLDLPKQPYREWWPCNGHIWAMRRDVLARHGLYDGSIIGGGDTAYLCAVAGCIEMVKAHHHMNPDQCRRYQEWAEPVFNEVGGSIGVLDTEIEHLWHGTLEGRRWRARHPLLASSGFDPYTDIRIDETGVWQWASDKPELHQLLETYFAERQEDSHLMEVAKT